MLCQSCNKNKATIHFTKIINGNVEEKHLCDICAKANSDFDFPFPFHKLFTGLLEISEPDQMEHPNFKKINCPRCGLDYKKFLETGKFGCAKCYEVFGDEIEILLKDIHGHSNHTGKVPVKAETKILQKREIENLKKELEENIKVENFEKAAIIRDEIKKISKKMGISER
jgi:protein arginine kinase activator